MSTLLTNDVPRLFSTSAEPQAARTMAHSHGERWLLWLPGFCAALLILTRLLTSQSLEHDEAEQLLFTQQLAWGYSLQPPLYTWITWLALQIFGVNLFALTVGKAALLIALFTFTSLLLQRLAVPRAAATAAALTLLFSPFFAWNVTLNLTHTVLASTVFAATVLHACRLIERPTACRYLVLGLLMALGVLAKYNFVVFAGALLLAGLTLPGARRVILDVRMLLAGGVGLTVLSPHLCWLFSNWDGVFEVLQARTGLHEPGATWTRVPVDLLALLGQTAFLALPIAAGYMLCLGRADRRFYEPADNTAPTLALLERTGLILLGLMAVLILGGVSRTYAGWLAPGLILVPLALCGRIAAQGWPAPLGQRLGRLVLVIALATTALKVSFFGQWHGRNLGRDLLFADAGAHLQAQGWSDRCFYADNLVTAGNLRFYAPTATVTSFDLPLLPTPNRTGAAQILVWNATETPTPTAARFLAAIGMRDPMDNPQVQQVVLPRRDLHPRFRRLAFYEAPGP
jgi:4-amino-4-deoxy-L-arabinose transferase-like glycosyltransferase